jgi:REP element-mobilizing transposase RayT
MVIAYHVIISAYGFWLPNDERGSWSDFVRRWELLRFGPVTKVNTRRSIAGRSFDRDKATAARSTLLYPAVSFTGRQALAIGNGFADGVRRSGYRILACAILPEHAHLVIGRHKYHVEQVTNRLKGAATRELSAVQLHPLADYHARDGAVPSPWSEGLWKVFLSDLAEVQRAVEYVEKNPEKEKKPRQHWSFVTPLKLWRRS